MQKKTMYKRGKIMDKNTTFSYSYSAAVNKEVQEIRKKYLPPEENKLDELKRLDYQVKMSGMTESLSLGIVGMLIFGLGVCLTAHIIGDGIMMILLGVVLGIIGAIGMVLAYPLYRRVFIKTKTKLTPRILQLAAELSGEKI